MMAANACNATVLGSPCGNSRRNLRGAVGGGYGFRIDFVRLKARSSWRVTKPSRVSRATIHHLVRNAFILGGMWAIVPISFFEHANPGGQMLMTGLCAGMLAGGGFAFATIPVAALFHGADISWVGHLYRQKRRLCLLLIAVLVMSMHACFFVWSLAIHSNLRDG